MKDFCRIDGSNIHYNLEGNGDCIIFLHGYLENLTIWDDYAAVLSNDYKVLRIDLPGHGLSISKLDLISMDYMAKCLNAVLTSMNIPKGLLIGHSMGGYASLAFAEKYPEKLSGLCLFHSTPNPDTEEKRLARRRDIDLLIHGRKEVIVNTNIPKLFATDRLEELRSEVDHAKDMALSTPEKGIIGSLRGMSERPDRKHIFQEISCPSMMIFGVKDNLIPMTMAEYLAENNRKTRTVFLNNSGHMGFIEDRDQALNEIISFCKVVFR